MQVVTGGINYNFSHAEQRESKQMRMDSQSKLLPHTEIKFVCYVQIIPSPATIVGQIESKISISVTCIRNHHH